MRSSGRLCISMQILEEAANCMYAEIQICSVVCSLYNARSEPNFLSSESLVKEVKADSCSPINSIMEELWKLNIFLFQSKKLWTLNYPVSLIVKICPSKLSIGLSAGERIKDKK